MAENWFLKTLGVPGMTAVTVAPFPIGLAGLSAYYKSEADAVAASGNAELAGELAAMSTGAYVAAVVALVALIGATMLMRRT